jgi:hypothetical protein
MGKAIYHKKDMGIKITDADDNIILSVAKITDGTVDTTSGGIEYGWVKNGELLRDKDGKVKVSVHQAPIFEPGRQMVEVLPDPTDVFIWYVKNGNPVQSATHEEFVKILADAKIEADKSFAQKKADESKFVKDVAQEVIASSTKDKKGK